MSWVGGRGTLGRHLIHYILHSPFYKRALCWSGAGALGGDSSPRSSWKDRWKLVEQFHEAGPSLERLLAGPQPVNGHVTLCLFFITVFTEKIKV